MEYYGCCRARGSCRQGVLRLTLTTADWMIRRPSETAACGRSPGHIVPCKMAYWKEALTRVRGTVQALRSNSYGVLGHGCPCGAREGADGPVHIARTSWRLVQMQPAPSWRLDPDLPLFRVSRVPSLLLDLQAQLLRRGRLRIYCRCLLAA